VQRWLDSRPRGEAAIWIETLPYFETRDYVPRVLAFTTLYDWRLDRPVTRLTARMPWLGTAAAAAAARPVADVVCRVSDRGP